jgi:tetratricopeptide (TPR) repeat protein
MVNLVEDLLQQGMLVQVGGQWQLQGDLAQIAARLPEKLQQLLVKQIEGLSVEEQQILAVASVEGMHFTASVIAAGAQRAVEDVEAMCDTLIRQERLVFAHEVQEWPNGTISARYGFRHGLYQTVLYNRLGSARRVRLHRLIGEHKEASYGERAREMAGELAVHFERGRDLRRAVQYQRQAAANALRRGAHQEAIVHCTQGLALLTELPETVERKQLELALRMPLGAAVAALQGYATDELEQNMQRARALCQELDGTANLVLALATLTRLYMMRADRAATEELMEQERQLLERVRDPACVAVLHTQLGSAETFRGTHARAQAHQAAALGLYDSAVQSSPVFSAGLDPMAVTLAISGWSLCLSGWLDQAWSHAERGLLRGEGALQSFSLSIVLLQAANIRQFRGELDAAQDLAQKLIALGQEHRFVFYEVSGSLTHGCILVQQRKPEEGIALITAGLAQYRATHSQLFLPYFLSFLAGGYLQVGKTAESMEAVLEALRLTEANFDRFWEAEVYRIKGEVVLQSGVRGSESQKESQRSKVKSQKSKMIDPRAPTPDPQGEAETCFHKAIEIARRQGAKSLELRAVMSLSRLWQQQGKQHEARNLLSEIYSWFTEGFGTTDLREAKALLDQCADSNRLESLATN